MALDLLKEKHYDKAEKWLKKASDAGHDDAKIKLGELQDLRAKITLEALEEVGLLTPESDKSSDKKMEKKANQEEPIYQYHWGLRLIARGDVTKERLGFTKLLWVALPLRKKKWLN